MVWFLAARHLLEDRAFADQVWQALQATLAQDRAVVFDAQDTGSGGQLADQQRPRGVVPGRASPAGGSRVCRPGLAGAAGHAGAGPR
ncbi:hypothetical protein C7E18_22990, partial [Stenotrophomonas maltophilia]